MEVTGTKPITIYIDDITAEQIVINKLKHDYEVSKTFNDPESLKDTEAIKQVLDMYGEEV